MLSTANTSNAFPPEVARAADAFAIQLAQLAARSASGSFVQHGRELVREALESGGDITTLVANAFALYMRLPAAGVTTEVVTITKRDADELATTAQKRVIELFPEHVRNLLLGIAFALAARVSQSDAHSGRARHIGFH